MVHVPVSGSRALVDVRARRQAPSSVRLARHPHCQCKCLKSIKYLSANFLTANLSDKGPDRWKNAFEVKVRGLYMIRFVYTIPRQDLTAEKSLHIFEKTKRITVIPSDTAQHHIVHRKRDYATLKRATNRLLEFTALSA